MNFNAPGPVAESIYTDGRAFGVLMEQKGWTWERCNYWINMVFDRAYKPNDTFLCWSPTERKQLAALIVGLDDAKETD